MSLPEVVWVVSAFIGTWVATQGWHLATMPRDRLKNGIRIAGSGMLLLNGLLAAFTPPAVNPTWLSVFTPMAIAFSASGMALLSVIDKQAVDT